LLFINETQIDMKNNKTKYIKARVTEQVKLEFENHCKLHNYNPAQRLRVIIEKELRNEIK